MWKIELDVKMTIIEQKDRAGYGCIGELRKKCCCWLLGNDNGGGGGKTMRMELMMMIMMGTTSVVQLFSPNFPISAWIIGVDNRKKLC